MKRTTNRGEPTPTKARPVRTLWRVRGVFLWPAAWLIATGAAWYVALLPPVARLKLADSDGYHLWGVSSDNRWVAATHNLSLAVWSATTGELRHRIPNAGPYALSNCVPTNRSARRWQLIAEEDDDSRPRRLFRLDDDGRLRPLFGGRTLPAHRFYVAPNLRWMVFEPPPGTRQGEAYVYDGATGEPVARLPDGVHPVRILPDNVTLLAHPQDGSRNGDETRLTFWNFGTRTAGETLTDWAFDILPSQDESRGVAYDRKAGAFIVVGAGGGTRRVPAEGAPRSQLYKLTISPDGGLVTAKVIEPGLGEDNYRIGVWDVASGRRVFLSEVRSGEYERAVARRFGTTPDDVRLLVTPYYKAELWDLRQAPRRLALSMTPFQVTDGTGRVVAATAVPWDAPVDLFATRLTPAGECTFGFSGPRFASHFLSESPDGRWALSGGKYDIRRGEVARWLADHLPYLDQSWTRHENRLVDLAAGTVAATFSDCDETAFAPDGSFLAVQDRSGAIRLYDLPPRYARLPVIGLFAALAALAFATARRLGPRIRRVAPFTRRHPA